MQVAKKKVVSSKAKKAVRTTSASKKHTPVKISTLKEHKHAAKGCRHFLRQVSTFNGLVIKLTKAKLGDKRYIVNVNRSFEKMEKLWKQYDKLAEKLNEAEKHAHASHAHKKAAHGHHAHKKTAHKSVKAKHPTTAKKVTKTSAAKKHGTHVKKKAVVSKSHNVVKIHSKAKHAEAKH